jgi:C-terminal processing protease CtpA/Prc
VTGCQDNFQFSLKRASTTGMNSASSDADGDSSSGNEEKNVSSQLNQSLSNLAVADDLVSVTVRKTSPDQKAGVSLVERKGRVYVTKVTEQGLFHGSEIEVGDVVLSINGKRLKNDEGAKTIIEHISKAKTNVTMVVKKANRKARRGVRSLSPTAHRRQRGKIFKKSFKQNEDGR